MRGLRFFFLVKPAVRPGGPQPCLLTKVSWCLRTLFALTLPFFFLGCLSIQWQDENGVDHHVGFLVVQTFERAEGREFHRSSLGLDLRFSGLEPGFSLGWRRLQGKCPEVIPVKYFSDLDEVVERLTSTGPLDDRSEPRWSFFYFRDDERLSQTTTLLRSTLLGLEAAIGASGGRLSLGFADHVHYVGKVLQDDIVQVLWADSEDPSRFRLVLWEVVR